MHAKNSFGKYAVMVLIGVIMSSCSYHETVTRRTQLKDPFETGEITVMTTQKAVYRLANYRVMDSAIIGTGYLDDEAEKTRFTGNIAFSDIAYIEVQKTSVWKGIGVGSAIAVFGAVALGSFGGSEGLSVTPVITRHYGSGGGSCPFIYSWNGNDYTVEGEAIGVAWGRALELTTCSVLRSLKEDHGEMKIRISNERPETHYLNDVNLVAVETDADAAVCVDAQNNLWPVYESVPPARAHDQTGSDVTSALQRDDGIYWESNLDSKSREDKFHDTVEVVFVKPASQRTASLVVHAINTKIFDVVIRMMSQILGNESLAFVDAVENDPEMIAILKHWLDESSLKAFLWNGSRWDFIGAIRPDADEVPFSQIIRFNASGIAGDSVKIRLTSLSDVWKLDAVGIDWHAVQPLKPEPVHLISATGAKGKDLREALACRDDKYAVLLPPEKVDFRFQSLQPHHGKSIVYALNVGGYLHEWFPREPIPSGNAERPTEFSAVRDMRSDAKLSFLKELLTHESVLLPLLYCAWEQQKNTSN